MNSSFVKARWKVFGLGFLVIVFFGVLQAVAQALPTHYKFEPRITVTPGSEANPQNQTDTPVPYEVAVRFPLYKTDPAAITDWQKAFAYYSPLAGSYVQADFMDEFRRADADPKKPSERVVSSDVKSMEMVFPGAQLSVGLANKLAFCSEAQFAEADLNNDATCPADSQLANVNVLTHIDMYKDMGGNPVALNGKAFIGKPDLGTSRGDVYPLYISVNFPALGQFIKLKGDVMVNKPGLPAGTIAASFPLIASARLAILEMKFGFRGGAEAAMVNPVGCGRFEGVSRLVPLVAPSAPFSLTKEVDVSASVTTSYDGAGGACPAVLPFDPSVSASLSSSQVGGSPQLETRLVRPDRDQRFKRFTLTFPSGSLAKIAAVPACNSAAALRGSCGGESKIGEADVVAGSGAKPVTFPGELFLTAPFVEGHPAGMVMRVQAKAGPLELGEMNIAMDAQIESGDNVRMKISTIDPLPTMFRGIPVSVREARIRITREGFLTNRTSCVGGPDSQLKVAFEGVDGSVVERAQEFAYTGCDRAPFTPSVEARTSAQGVGGHSSLAVTIHSDPSQPAILGTDVVIPSEALALDAGNVKELCSMDAFRAGGCSPRTIVGKARVDTPMLANPVGGDIVVLQAAGALPRIGVDIRGDGIRAQLVGELSLVKGGLLTKFGSMPDFQASQIFMEFSGGASGVLKPREGMCAKQHVFAAKFYAHSGAVRDAGVPLVVDGCGNQTPLGASGRVTMSGIKRGKPKLVVDVAQGADAISGVSVRVPSGVKFAGKKGFSVKTAVSGKKSPVKLVKKGWKARGSSFQFTGSKAGIGRLVLQVSGKGLRVSGKARKALLKKRVSGLKVIVRLVNGKTATVPVKVSIK